MPRERLAGGYLYYDATTDDARLVLTIARTAAEHGAVVANRCRVVALTKDGAGRVDGATVDAGGRQFDVAAARRRQRRRRVGRRGAHARGRRRPGLDPPGQGRPHHGAVGEGAQRHRRRHPGARRQAQPVRRAVGADRPTARSEHTYVGTTDTDYDGPLDDPPCTADDIAYVLRALNDAVTTGDHDRRRHRRVGRAAPARQVGDERPHRRPVPAPPGDDRDRPASSPSPAAS